MPSIEYCNCNFNGPVLLKQSYIDQTDEGRIITVSIKLSLSTYIIYLLSIKAERVKLPHTLPWILSDLTNSENTNKRGLTISKVDWKLFECRILLLSLH